MIQGTFSSTFLQTILNMHYLTWLVEYIVFYISFFCKYKIVYKNFDEKHQSIVHMGVFKQVFVLIRGNVSGLTLNNLDYQTTYCSNNYHLE